MSYDIKVEAEKHWEYTAKLLESAGVKVTPLHKFLYIQAMVHGFKHSQELSK